MTISREDGLEILFHMLSVIGQSIFFGVLLFTFPVSIYILCRQGIHKLRTKINLALITIMFALSATFWSAALADVILLILDHMKSDSAGESTTVNRPLFNALVLINFVITDGFVVWRAWKISGEKRTALFICTAFLVLTGVSVVLTIAVRIMTFTPLNRPFFVPLINATQTVNLGLSLLTNLIATSIIGIRAVKHSRDMRAVKGNRNAAQRALLLLIESGLIYCVSGIVVLVATLIRLPFGTLGDIYQPVHSQLSGVYPTALLILVSQRKSLANEIKVSSTTPSDSLTNKQPQNSIRFRELTTGAVTTTTDFESMPRGIEIQTKVSQTKSGGSIPQDARHEITRDAEKDEVLRYIEWAESPR